MALPSGYTPLEYIESTGSQYVDTGYAPTYQTRVVAKYTVESSTGWLFGCRDTNSSTSPNQFGVFVTSATTVRSDYFGTSVTGTVASATGTVVLDKNKNVLNYNGGVITNTSVTDGACTRSMWIFTINNAGSTGTFLKGKLDAYEIYENGTLVRDYVPCINASGTVGLYDMVNGTFGGDAAGVGFVAGPVAAQPEAPASLEVIGTTRNAVVLAWPGAPVGQSYRLYRDGVVVYEGSALCYTDAGLAAGSAHVYSVHTVIGSTESEGVTTEATTTEGIVLITDRTAADVSAGRRKGYYNALDLIRVGEAMVYLDERFAAVGISVTVSPKLDWQLSDIPTHAQALHYLTDIGVLRGKLTEFRETVSLPGSLNALTWAQANDIETILLDVEKLIQTIILSFRHYSGRAISGVNALP